MANVKAKEKEEVFMADPLTMEIPEEKPGYTGPMVDVFLPELEGSDGGKTIDQYEHVTLANEKEEQIYYVRRGEHVSVPVPVFLALKEKYPKI